MREDVDRFPRFLSRCDRLDQAKAVPADRLIDRDVFLRDFAGALISSSRARRWSKRRQRFAHFIQRPFQVDRGRARRDQRRIGPIECGI